MKNRPRIIPRFNVMKTHPNPTVKAMHAYYWQFGVALMAYVIAIMASRNFLHSHPGDGPAHVVIALLPIIPQIFLFAAIVRFVRATDELQRQIIVHSLALAGGVTALLAFAYSLIEGDSFPPPHAWWTYGTFLTSWVIASIFVRRHYR